MDPFPSRPLGGQGPMLKILEIWNSNQENNQRDGGVRPGWNGCSLQRPDQRRPPQAANCARHDGDQSHAQAGAEAPTDSLAELHIRRHCVNEGSYRVTAAQYTPDRSSQPLPGVFCRALLVVSSQESLRFLRCGRLNSKAGLLRMQASMDVFPLVRIC